MDTVDIYDDSTGTWSLGPPLSQARAVGRGASTSVGSRAIFAGGQLNGAGALTKVVDIFDGQTGTMSAHGLPTARVGIGVTAIGVVWIGGYVPKWPWSRSKPLPQCLLELDQ